MMSVLLIQEIGKKTDGNNMVQHVPIFLNETPFFIAEVSSNHGKDLKRCLDFIDCAADIGCHAVKFQLFKIDQLFSFEALNKHSYLRDRIEWELPVDFLPYLKERCLQKGIKFGCTPFYLEAVNELYEYVDFYKISSYELLWHDLIVNCAKTLKPLIISTGMSEINEIQSACAKVMSVSNLKPYLLHCTSSYPTPLNEANLSAIETIRNFSLCEVGWSDHTVSEAVIYRAVHKWSAKIIEFHLDLDGAGDEYKTGHCWLPNQMKNVILNIRQSFDADGLGIKEPVNSELIDRGWRADPIDGLRPLISTRSTL